MTRCLKKERERQKRVSSEKQILKDLKPDLSGNNQVVHHVHTKRNGM